jgi:hypothetical protein
MSVEAPHDSTVRQKTQLIFVVILVSMTIILPIWYVTEVGIDFDDELVKTIIVGSWTLAIAGAGMAFSQIGLGRQVT